MTMKIYQKLLALFLIGLFLAFSFNAYACVVPVYNDIPFTKGGDCTMPGEEPAFWFCDGFKSLAVHSSHEGPLTVHFLLPVIGEVSLLLPEHVRSRPLLSHPDDGHMVLQEDILLRISVFRI
jgi:hypothetical protein